MKLPEPAPKLDSINQDDQIKLLSLQNREEVRNLIRKANDGYVYWDKFKYFEKPADLTNESAWILLKMVRLMQSKIIPMRNKDNKRFFYWLTDKMQKELHYIDKYSTGQILVDDSAIISGEKDRYLISSLMEEAIASSQLEGAATTRMKAKMMLRTGRKPESTAEKMILNNYKTIREIKSLLNEPLSERLLLQIQDSLTVDTLENPKHVGRFRTQEDEDICVVDERDGQVLHVPPPPDEIKNRLEELYKFANETNENEFIHPIIKAIILHFWLAYIHPFCDGNGRTARALFYWYVLKSGYWVFEFLSVSRIILKAPAQYARAYLYSEIDDLDINYFIEFNLRTICLAIESLQIYLKRRQGEQKTIDKVILDYPRLNKRQQNVLRHATTHPNDVCTIKFIMNAYGTVYQTARTDLLQLTKKGFLDKKKRGKEFIFIPAKDINEKLNRKE
ncbi:MAG: hypothetical protein A3J83_03140 [Elusimicrobia bacterium RIFOXYA2_FULL_40_6]|nr:MAG: hypothetical protein A3J83_03140 [Elusimicrobia bacterium RIFOXYA2_FULL_40_6]